MSSLSADSSVENPDVSSFSPVAPNSLPLFQWVGSIIRDERKEDFADIEECLRPFENVLSSHTLSFDKHCFRLLPRCLSNNLRGWFSEYVLVSGFKVSCIILKTTITRCDGVIKEQLRFEGILEFLSYIKLEGETADRFMGRFKKLKTKDEVTDCCVIVKMFFNAFPVSVSC